MYREQLTPAPADRRPGLRFLADERGGVTIDFIGVFVPVILFILMVCEIGIAFHLTSSAQKGAQLAARFAAVREPVHADVWSENRANPNSTLNLEEFEACYQSVVLVNGGAPNDVAPVEPDNQPCLAPPDDPFSVASVSGVNEFGEPVTAQQARWQGWTCDGANLSAACDAEEFNKVVGQIRRLYPYARTQDVAVSYIYRSLGSINGPFIPEVAVTISERPMPINLLSLVGLLRLRAVTSSVLGEDMSTGAGGGGGGLTN